MDNTSSSSPYASAVPQMRFGKIDDLTSRVAAAVDGARKFLFSDQHEEGYWCGELEADTTLESDYILLHTLLGTGDRERFQKAARYILQHQNDDGGWSISAGDRSFPQLVLVQHLRDFLVVARHPGAAFHLLCEKAFQENSGRNGCG